MKAGGWQATTLYLFPFLKIKHNHLKIKRFFNIVLLISIPEIKRQNV